MLKLSISRLGLESSQVRIDHHASQSIRDMRIFFFLGWSVPILDYRKFFKFFAWSESILVREKYFLRKHRKFFLHLFFIVIVVLRLGSERPPGLSNLH